MIQLYHCAGTRSFRALWALEELGLPYQLHIVPFPPRVLRPEFLTLNPLGTVPLLLDGGVNMTESVAIVQYLVARARPTSLAVDPGEADYGLWLDWLIRGEATFTFPQTIQTVRKLSVMKPPVVLLVRGAETADMFGFPAASWPERLHEHDIRHRAGLYGSVAQACTARISPCTPTRLIARLRL